VPGIVKLCQALWTVSCFIDGKAPCSGQNIRASWRKTFCVRTAAGPSAVLTLLAANLEASNGLE
jgi:hypothetical protein